MNSPLLAPYSGFAFWSILSLFVLIVVALRFVGTTQAIRNVFMIAVSVLVIALAQYDKEYSLTPLLVCLLALTVAVYYTGRFLMNRTSHGLRFNLLWGAVVIIVIFLCYFKYSQFQIWVDTSLRHLVASVAGASERAERHFFLLGVSYFSFKFIHYLVDSYYRKIKELNLLTFINYTLFFPSFFSGPINRYDAFADSIRSQSAPPGLSEYVEGGKRMINGLFKKTAGALLLPYSIASLDFGDGSVTPTMAIIGIYAYMFYIYLDFSGYSDLAIGAGRLVGVNLPENFNYPFLKRNLQQFWANWHMSLTAWLTDYIYWPLAKKLRHLKEFKRRPVLLSCISIIVTFMICGLWHGDGLNFFIWGTYHGLGLAILNIYTQFEKKHFPLKWRKFINVSRVGYAAGCFITFQYAAFGFLLFGCDMAKLRTFFQLFS